MRVVFPGALRTGACARFARTSRYCVQRAVDEGRLPAFTHPRTRFRWVRVADLRAWMVRRGLPTGDLDAAFPPAA